MAFLAAIPEVLGAVEGLGAAAGAAEAVGGGAAAAGGAEAAGAGGMGELLGQAKNINPGQFGGVMPGGGGGMPGGNLTGVAVNAAKAMVKPGYTYQPDDG